MSCSTRAATFTASPSTSNCRSDSWPTTPATTTPWLMPTPIPIAGSRSATRRPIVLGEVCPHRQAGFHRVPRLPGVGIQRAEEGAINPSPMNRLTWPRDVT